jgi:glutamyl-tRNA reductase
MSVMCLGLSHRTAPLAVRERLYIGKPELPGAAAMVRRIKGVDEAVVVSTCNRIELYLAGAGGPGAVRHVRSAVIRLLAKTRGVPARALGHSAYLVSDLEAVRHLIEVAAGLDSQVVGEAQILSQVREAHEAAMGAGATGPVLNGVFNRALAAAKRVRTETEIGRLPASVASVAVDLAERIFGELSGRSVLLVGTGETAELVALTLVERGALPLLVASGRHLDRARAIARRSGGEALELSSVADRLPEVDVVIAATSAREPVLRRDDVAGAMRARRARPLFLVDLGVPRNIEAGAGDLADVYLYDLDDLKAVADGNLKRREEWAGPAREIVGAEAAECLAWLDSLGAVPVIRDLQKWGEDRRREVMARAGRRVRDLPPGTREEVEYLTKALVAKLLHHPIVKLRESGGGSFGELVRRLFRLP